MFIYDIIIIIRTQRYLNETYQNEKKIRENE